MTSPLTSTTPVKHEIVHPALCDVIRVQEREIRQLHYRSDTEKTSRAQLLSPHRFRGKHSSFNGAVEKLIGSRAGIFLRVVDSHSAVLRQRCIRICMILHCGRCKSNIYSFFGVNISLEKCLNSFLSVF